MNLNDTTALKGVLERIIFFNDENAYCIAEVADSKTNKKITSFLNKTILKIKKLGSNFRIEPIRIVFIKSVNDRRRVFRKLILRIVFRFQ